MFIDKGKREVETVTGTVAMVNKKEPPTLVRLKELHTPLWRPRVVAGERDPQPGETWTFTIETVEKEEVGTQRYILEEKFEQDAKITQYKQSYPLFQADELHDPNRPNYEDAEWYHHIRDQRNQTYRSTEDVYLDSGAWKRKRKNRLILDDYICQAGLPGCTAKATEVHHIGYSHLGNEPLWELKSVCSFCHEAITAMDRGKRKP